MLKKLFFLKKSINIDTSFDVYESRYEIKVNKKIHVQNFENSFP